MEQHQDIVKQCVDLSETIQEATNHINQLMENGQHMNSMGLMQDVVVGLTSIEQSLSSVFEENDINTILVNVNESRESIKEIVSSLEQNDMNLAYSTWTSSIMPTVKLINEELTLLNKEIN